MKNIVLQVAALVAALVFAKDTERFWFPYLEVWRHGIGVNVNAEATNSGYKSGKEVVYLVRYGAFVEARVFVGASSSHSHFDGHSCDIWICF